MNKNNVKEFTKSQISGKNNNVGGIIESESPGKLIEIMNNYIHVKIEMFVGIYELSEDDKIFILKNSDIVLDLMECDCFNIFRDILSDPSFQDKDPIEVDIIERLDDGINVFLKNTMFNLKETYENRIK